MAEYNFTRPVASIPSISEFEWLNQGSSTIEETNSGHLMFVDGSGANAMRGRIQSIPNNNSDGSWSVTMRFKQWTRGSFHECGLILRDSISGRLVFFGHSHSQANIVKQNWNSATSFSSSTDYNETYSAGSFPPELWLRIENDGANNSFQYSLTDGATWNELASESETAWLTNPADQAGYAGDCTASTDFYFRTDYFELLG